MVKEGGKRIRPALTFAAAEAVGLKDEDIRQKVLDHIACAIELLHSYSLVHDDLPSMDNDDYVAENPLFIKPTVMLLPYLLAMVFKQEHLN